jgi:hypothetical protein
MAYKIKNPKVKEKENYEIKMIDIKKIEHTASQIMKIDNKIWEKYGWTSGSAVQQDIYNAELKKKLNEAGIVNISWIYSHIFEDANYHTLNRSLESAKVFKKGETYAGTEKDFEEYAKKGGKTWEL